MKDREKQAAIKHPIAVALIDGKWGWMLEVGA